MSDPQPPRLLDQVRQPIRLRHFSLKTEKSYVHYIRDFILFHNQHHPKDMGADEIRDYLSHLAIERNVAASTQTVALSALLFLYRHVLQIDLPYIDDIERAKRPERLPVVFTHSEVKQILVHLDGVHWLIVSLLYGKGEYLAHAHPQVGKMLTIQIYKNGMHPTRLSLPSVRLLCVN